MLARKTGSVPVLSRRHFEFIAEVISTMPVTQEQREVISVWFADNLRASNPLFQRDQFLERSTKG